MLPKSKKWLLVIIFDDSKIIFISVPALHQQAATFTLSTPFTHFQWFAALAGDATGLSLGDVEPIDKMLYLVIVHILFDRNIVFKDHSTIIIPFLFKPQIFNSGLQFLFFLLFHLLTDMFNTRFVYLRILFGLVVPTSSLEMLETLLKLNKSKTYPMHHLLKSRL